jgi:hypothetical protein
LSLRGIITPPPLFVITRQMPSLMSGRTLEKIVNREKLSPYELSRQDDGACYLGVSSKRPAVLLLQSDRYPFRPGLDCAAAVSQCYLLYCRCLYRHSLIGTGEFAPEFLFGPLLVQSAPDSFTPFTLGNAGRVRMEYRQRTYPVAAVNLSAEFPQHINHAIRRRN